MAHAMSSHGMRSLVNALKQLTWFYVIDHPDLVSVQTGQRARIKQNDDRGAYDERTACHARAVIDFARAVIDSIASMTEVEFDRMHRQLCGTSGNG